MSAKKDEKSLKKFQKMLDISFWACYINKAVAESDGEKSETGESPDELVYLEN